MQVVFVEMGVGVDVKVAGGDVDKGDGVGVWFKFASVLHTSNIS